MLRLESCFVLIPFCDSNVVISLANVKFGEEHLVPQILQGLLDVWQGVIIAYCPFIYLPVVHDDVFFFRVLFIYEIHW